jgi:hypothetical protein
MRSRARQLALVLLMLTAAACRGKPGGPAPLDEPTSVRVENQGFIDMTIYILEGGSRIRLGFVPGNSTSTFVIPRYLMSGPRALRFLADPVGPTRAPVSDEMSVLPGDHIVLTIPPS